MTNRRTLNARNLEALGAATLAELLIEVSGGNAVIQRRLRPGEHLCRFDPARGSGA
jgi:hypothetical protein